MSTDHAGMYIVAPEDSRELLRGHPLHLGRVAFVTADGDPIVLPVNFRLDGTDVVVRTDDSELLAAVRAGRTVAFEADDVDPAWQDGWSVLVRGPAEEITDAGDLDRVRRLPLHPWAPGPKAHWLRLPTDRISGRRIL